MTVHPRPGQHLQDAALHAVAEFPYLVIHLRQSFQREVGSLAETYDAEGVFGAGAQAEFLASAVD